MKKVLMITYYWPPAGGPGVQRVLKFAKYLPEFGWEPVILTVENGNYPAIDESLLKEIPKNCKVYKTKIFEPFLIYKTITGKKENIPTFVLNKDEKESITEKLSKWIRANIFIPDAKMGWKKYIIKEGLKIIKEEKPDLIFSSSPPHSLQIGAMELAKKSGLKWAADFRDPWTTAFWQKDISRIKYADRKDKRFERYVLRKANAITSVSKSIVKDFSQIYSNNYFVLPNGFDENDFENIGKQKSDKFRINYTGTLSRSQKINNFLSAIKHLGESYLENIEINFYGTFHPDIRDKIDQAGLSDMIKLNPEVPHEEVLKIMVNSEILLLVIPDTFNNYGIVTGKIFEYLATHNYILGIGPVNGDASEILNETNCGKMFGYDDDLSSVIKKRIEAWLENKQLEVNREAIDNYSREEITKNLTKVFAEVL